MLCSCGESMQEAGSRDETVDEDVVVYRTQRIKHFDREGCEFWADTRMPDIETRKLARRVTTYHCPSCGASRDEQTMIADDHQATAVSAPAGDGGAP